MGTFLVILLAGLLLYFILVPNVKSVWLRIVLFLVCGLLCSPYIGSEGVIPFIIGCLVSSGCHRFLWRTNTK